MLTCIARSKQGRDQDSSSPAVDHHLHQPAQKLSPNAVKSLSSQIKDMALKASGAYRHCANQPPPPRRTNGVRESELAAADKFRWSYRRTGSSNSSSTAGRRELEARLKGISSGEGTPASASGRRLEPVVFVEENEAREWVAQVEPGVLITFLSLPRGGNDLKRIRFSREMFNKWQAQRWWAENSEKVIELHNVQRLSPQAFPLPATPHSEDGSSSKMDSVESSPVTPPLGREPLPRTINNYRQMGMGQYSSSDTSDIQSMHSPTPKLSSISGAKTETSSMSTTSSSREGDVSISNPSDLETEWVEQDEPGVYITIRALLDGRRELKRVRFSREKFGELHAKLWWEENRARIHRQYL